MINKLIRLGNQDRVGTRTLEVAFDGKVLVSAHDFNVRIGLRWVNGIKRHVARADLAVCRDQRYYIRLRECGPKVRESESQHGLLARTINIRHLAGRTREGRSVATPARKGHCCHQEDR